MSMNKYFKIPFATTGDKNAIPVDTQPSGSVSYQQGFGPDYELDPLSEPSAKNVPRDESNQLYFDITTAIKEYQEFGTPDFITTAINGGSPFSYGKYARVKWTDDAVYESRVDANTATPADATKWRKLTENLDFLAIATTAFQASVTDGAAVYWAGTEFDEAVADGTNKQRVLGFADVTNGRVFVAGLYAGQLSGMTPGSAYYLSTSTPGAITLVESPVRIGIAKNATDMYISVTAAGSVPTGTIIDYGADTPPAGFLKANGAILSRATYAALFAVIGETFGNGDGSTTFQLPDLRGEFTRGWDDGRGIDSGRVFGSYQAGTEVSTTVYQAAYIYITNGEAYRAGSTVSRDGDAGYSGPQGFYRVRPRNIALLRCIKY